MSEMHEGTTSELPLDFTQFLSSRLGTDAGNTLSLLGTFLLEFEPAGPRASSAPLQPSQLPTS
jgi:hypothetical protein